MTEPKRCATCMQVVCICSGIYANVEPELDYGHIRKYIDSFNFKIVCIHREGFFKWGVYWGSRFKCPACKRNLKWTEIPVHHNLEGGHKVNA